MKIAVIGTGYVGLTTGTCLAELGNNVICVDIDEQKIENLKKNIIPIYEPGLEELVERNQKEGRLKFSTNTKDAIQFASVVFSAVGTPEGKDQKPELKYVKQVAREFGEHINEYKIFVNKSTVPVGTGDLCKKIIKEVLEKRGAEINFDAVSNPEFLREGTAIKDTMHPDRIVVGTENDKSKEIMKSLYSPLTDQGIEILFTDLQTAEIIKYAANSFLATKISFINEIANFCEKAGGDIKMVSKGIGLDKRIGTQFLNAGIGYGGSCFPKDVKALIQTGKEFDNEFKIITAVDKINTAQKEILIKKLKKEINDLKDKKIAIWGLAFKPGTDDMREAPSITIIENLLNNGAFVQAFDPVATSNAKKIFAQNKNASNINYTETPKETLKNADALLILTEWPEFKQFDYTKLKDLMKKPLILDGRNILSKEKMKKIGVEYVRIG